MSFHKRSKVDIIWEEFWQPILVKNNQIDLEQLKKELADFSYILEQIPLVYDHITGGLLSKPLYSADTVIQAADEHYRNL